MLITKTFFPALARATGIYALLFTSNPFMKDSLHSPVVYMAAVKNNNLAGIIYWYLKRPPGARGFLDTSSFIF